MAAYYWRAFRSGCSQQRRATGRESPARDKTYRTKSKSVSVNFARISPVSNSANTERWGKMARRWEVKSSLDALRTD
jgi:hypothetical protein